MTMSTEALVARIESATSLDQTDSAMGAVLLEVRAAAMAIVKQGLINSPEDVPEIAVILGSGLSGFEERVDGAIALQYQDVGLPSPSVAGHKGELVLGRIRNRRVAVLAGRVHYYEGHPMDTVVMATRTMAALGVSTLLVSNAAGTVNPHFRPGDLMLITDHVNLMGVNPLRGPNADGLGPRFHDMTDAYDRRIRGCFQSSAEKIGVPLRQGIYLAVSGPSYETPAEIRAFRTLGADAVGMSTIPEVITARHAGMSVGAISCITNMAAGLSREPLSHDEVKAIGASVGTTLADLFEETIGRAPCPNVKTEPTSFNGNEIA